MLHSSYFQNNIPTDHNLPYVDEQNDSANEGDSMDDHNNVTNSLNESECHPNMSDITSIQMQLDSIKV